MPYEKYSGKWDFGKTEDFNGLTQFLSENFKEEFNIDKWNYNLGNHLYFNSNIPIGYGLGSSGSLVAAIYQDYFLKKNEGGDLERLKSTFAKMESFFHGKSSGFDPLVSYTNKGLWSKIKTMNSIDSKNLPLENLYLFDSKSERNTSKLVSQFNLRMRDYDFKRHMNQLKRMVDKIIPLFMERNETWKDSYKEISQFQLQHLYAFIPSKVAKLWSKGIENKSYYFKLCGSGGGGFFLVYSEQYISDLPLISLNKPKF